MGNVVEHTLMHCEKRLSIYRIFIFEYRCRTVGIPIENTKNGALLANTNSKLSLVIPDLFVSGTLEFLAQVYPTPVSSINQV